ncbi:MAG: hypothetical protein J7K33_00185 [Candidatus Marinimicrobia bacterium]|nr:hypothetical protein [Candidatus Neomarinimicrobiota bacterium]
MNKILSLLVIVLILALPLSYIDYDMAKDAVFNISDAIGYQSPKKIILDESGVPYIEYKYQNGKYVGEKRRNPVTISQTGMKYLEKYYETKEEKYKELFLNCSDWLVENAKNKGDYSVWEYSSIIYYPNFTLYPPWVSGMAQGQGIQVLAYAYNLTGNEIYLNTAKSALGAFYVPVEEGGVLYIEDDGGWWYLEYGYKGEPKPKTLNGFIFALIGIHEYYRITKDDDALYLFNRGVDELKRHLNDYDTGSYTVYDLVGTPAGKYHEVHVKQMLTMYNLTGDPIFLEYYEKWKAYSNDPWNILTKRILNRLNIAIYVFNTIILFCISIFIMLIQGHRRGKGNRRLK